MNATRKHIIELGKFHKITSWACDIDGCYDLFNSEDEVIQHQEDDHERGEIFPEHYSTKQGVGQ